jgi:hypothetical protein
MFEIDVIESGARSYRQLELRGHLHEVCGNGDAAAKDQHFPIFDELTELATGLEADHDIVVDAQQFNRPDSDWTREENSHRRCPRLVLLEPACSRQG